jgi:hypothetical protein
MAQSGRVGSIGAHGADWLGRGCARNSVPCGIGGSVSAGFWLAEPIGAVRGARARAVCGQRGQPRASAQAALDDSRIEMETVVHSERKSKIGLSRHINLQQLLAAAGAASEKKTL